MADARKEGADSHGPGKRHAMLGFLIGCFGVSLADVCQALAVCCILH